MNRAVRFGWRRLKQPFTRHCIQEAHHEHDAVRTAHLQVHAAYGESQGNREILQQKSSAGSMKAPPNFQSEQAEQEHRQLMMHVHQA